MTNSEWLEHWLSRAPMLSDDDLADIQHVLTTAGEGDG